MGNREPRIGFKSLPRLWKVVTVGLAAWVALTLVAFFAFGTFIASFRAANDEARAAVAKNDADLIGDRLHIPREGKAPVRANIYFPEQDTGEPLPLVVNFHGGGFVGGDADEMDSQADVWANEWDVVVLSVNYTKADVKPIPYGVSEGAAAVQYMIANADENRIDPDEIHIMGHSAGAFYATQVARELADNDVSVASQILVAPWTNGLPSTVPQDMAPALFVLGGADPISQRSAGYQDVLKEADVPIQVRTYRGGLHPFISSPYPELSAGMSPAERSEFITPEQIARAHEAESDIHDWIEQSGNRG